MILPSLGLQCVLIAAYGVSLVNSVEYNTGCNELRDRDNQFLDRHDALCPTYTIMTGWRLAPDQCGSNGYVAFNCDGPPPGVWFASNAFRSTGCSNTRGPDLGKFDQHDLSCSGNEVMTRWKLQDCSSSSDDMRFDYTCASLSGGIGVDLQCSTYSTGCSQAVNERLQFLDRHPFLCPSPSRQYLQGWHFTRSGCGGNNMRMEYTCCGATLLTSSPTRAPTRVPTKMPTNFPTSMPTLSPVIQAGAGGDPHFSTWSGAKYDFHGHCDLVLLDNPSFAGNTGISIHIRSSPYKVLFSYISEAAIRIGSDVLEINSQGKHSMNGVAQTVGETEPLSGYAVTSTATKRGRYVYKIRLGKKEEIIIREFKDWITVSIVHATRSTFGNSVGLMGSFEDGTWYGRDGVSIHKDIISYGTDWQVKPDVDGVLFSSPSPYPDRCEVLDEKQARARHRRLEESPVTREQALEACQHWGASIEDCVSDVQITGDLEVALNEPIFE